MRSLRQRSFLHLAVADARRADPNALSGALDEGVDRLQVQIPAAIGHIVGMADTMPELRSATAHFTNFCHSSLSRTHPDRSTYKCSKAGWRMTLVGPTNALQSCETL